MNLDRDAPSIPALTAAAPLPSYRPELHFAPPGGWMNDPNGLVYHEGLWHLFYQHFPGGLTHGPMFWGHAVSKDLFDWEDWPIALAPDDTGHIWSGSALVVAEGILACFTHYLPGKQVQSYALSTDGGKTFVKDPNNPILTSCSGDFRDPKLFRYNDQIHMMVAAGPVAQIFGSNDGRNWSLVSELLAPKPGWIWECPDLFDLDGQWILLGSFIVPGEPHQTHYWIGAFDGENFKAVHGPQRLSFGPDDYAAVTWNDAPGGRRVLIGWMNRWDYAALTPTQADGFRGAMTLPRDLRIADGMLLQSCPPELAVRRRGTLGLDDLKDGKPVVVQGAFEIVAEIALSDLASWGFLFSTAEEEAVIVGYDPLARELFIDRTCAGLEFHSDFGALYSIALPAESTELKLHIVRDACSIELFVDGGKHYAAALIFPSSENCRVQLWGPSQAVRGGALHWHGGSLQMPHAHPVPCLNRM